MPNALTKQAADKSRRERKQRADRGHQQDQAPLRQAGLKKDRLERHPFGDESVQRRQAPKSRPIRQESRTPLGHAMNEPAELLHVALAGRAEHGARAEEQQALEQRMVEAHETARP